MQIEAILITHCHFDHVGAVAPVAAATGAPVYCPVIERPVLADIMSFVPFPGFGPFESYEAEHTVRGRRAADARRDWTSTSCSRRATAPGTSPTRSAATRALFSGDVLFQGSVGRVDLPGGDWDVLEASIGRLVGVLPARDGRVPGAHGRHDARARARQQSVPVRAARLGRSRPQRLLSKRIQAPRGTYDVLPDQAAARAGARTPRPRDPRGSPATSASRRRPSRRPSCSRAASARRPTSCRRRCTPSTAGDRSYTLRPEGTAPVCRAYVEHGMHKLPQPVKLWYLSSFFRHERAQAGRYRQFWQVGVEALGSEDPALDAESIVLLHTLLDAARHARPAPAPRRASATPPAAPSTGPSCRRTCAAHLDRLAPEVRERIDLNPLRAFDSDDPSTREVMASAPRLLDHLSDDGRRALRRGAGAARRGRDRLRGRSDARARPRLLHADRVRVHLRRARRPERRRAAAGATTASCRSSAAARRGPPTPGIGWAAGVERILLSAGSLPAAPRRRPSTSTWPPMASDRAERRAVAAFTIVREARLAGFSVAARSSPDARPRRRPSTPSASARDTLPRWATRTRSCATVRTVTSETLENDAVVHALLRGRRGL